MKRFRLYLSYLIYLPNITPFASIFKSEIFPWAFLYGLRKGLYFSNRYWLFLFYLLASGLFVLLSGKATFLGVSRSGFALLNASLPLFVILLLNRVDHYLLKRSFFWIFGIQLLFCLVQLLGFFPTFLGDAIRFFLARFNEEAHGSGRGVTGLFAEPSYLAVSMSYYFVFSIYLMRRRGNQELVVFLIVLLVLYQILVIRSGTGMVYLLLILLMLPKPKYILPILLGLIVVFVFVAAWWGKDEDAPRSLHLFYLMIYEQKYRDFYRFALSESGFRMVSVIGSILYGITHPFGSGLGAWGPASIESLDAVGLPASEFGYFVTYYGGMFEGIRPASFFADVMLELGWVGALLFFRFLWPFISRIRYFTDSATRPLLVLFLFNIFFLGTIGDPVPYVFLGLFSRQELSVEERKEIILGDTHP